MDEKCCIVQNWYKKYTQFDHFFKSTYADTVDNFCLHYFGWDAAEFVYLKLEKMSQKGLDFYTV